MGLYWLVWQRLRICGLVRVNMRSMDQAYCIVDLCDSRCCFRSVHVFISNISEGGGKGSWLGWRAVRRTGEDDRFCTDELYSIH